MKKIIFFSFSLILVSALILNGSAKAATENISQLVFTTAPQTVAPGAISEVLTIQTQNAAGSSEPIGDTADVSFQSSSPTGQFVNASGAPVTTTMNRNTSSRNFYYLDSSAGSYTLTASVTVRNGGPTWTATQAINVGSGAPPTDDDNSGDNDSGSSDDGNGQDAVAYAGSASLSKPGAVSKSPKPLAVDPGRRRLVAVGVPLNFKAKVSGGDNYAHDLVINWSFGDGEAALGREVAHAYYFPGTYIVMVNAAAGDEEAVGEARVEVVEPQAMVGEIGLAPRPYVQIVNRSPKELNLGYWQLRAGDKALTLPADTLIAGNTKINIPVDPAKIPLASAPSVALAYPNGRVIDSKPLMSEAAAPAPSELKTLVEQLNKALVKKPRPAAASNSPKPAPAVPAAPVTAAPAPGSKLPAASQVLVLPKAESAWSRVINKLF